MSLETLPMQARRGYISPGCKMLYKCDETAGDYITESISGVKLIPSTSIGDLTVGSLAYGTANAVSIACATNAGAPSQRKILIDLNLELSTRKVLLLAAHLLHTEALGTRVNIGLGTSGVLSLSLYNNDMHISFILEDGTSIASVNIDPNLSLAVDGTPNTLYVMWNGLTNTLTGKVLNADGSVTAAANAVAMSQSSGVVTAPTPDTFQPDNSTRLKGADYYSVCLWELDAVPNNLDYKLAQWGELARAGYKAAPDLL